MFELRRGMPEKVFPFFWFDKLTTSSSTSSPQAHRQAHHKFIDKLTAGSSTDSLQVTS
jgi:hypothetical protein